MDSRLDLIIRARDEASKAVKNLKDQIDSVENSTESLNNQSDKLGGTMSGAFSRGVQASKQYTVALLAATAALGALVVKYGSEVQNMNNRVLSLSDSQEQSTETFESLVGVAKRSRSDLTGVVSTFQRLEMTNKSLGIETEHTIRMTETISKGLQLSGASAAESSSAMLQLSQAYASGRLQGDEFRALSETFPMLMMQIQQSLGVTTAELKEMGSEGLITRDVINQALNEMAVTVERKFREMPITIGQAFTNMQTTVVATLARINEQTGVFDRIAEGIEWVSEKIEELLPKIVYFLLSLSPETIAIFAGAISGPLVVALGAATVAAAKFIIALAPIIALGAAIAASVMALKRAWESDFLGMQTIAQNFWNTLQRVFVSHIQPMLQSFWENAVIIFDQFKIAIDETGQTVMALWTNYIRPALVAIRDAWDTDFMFIKTIATTTFNLIVGIIKTNIAIIQSQITIVLSVIAGIWSTTMALLRGDWSAAWEAIKGTVTTITEQVKKVITSMINTIKSIFSKMPQEWKQYGIDFVMGFVNGITEGITFAVNAAKNLADQTSKAITNALGIKSPSTVMAQYGAWTVEGFANGIRGKQNLATAEVQKITQAISSQFGNDGEIMKKIREWTKNKELEERITEMVETSKQELEKLKENYAKSSESIIDSMDKLTENHNKNVDKLVKSLEDLENQMDSVRKKYKEFQQGEATDFGGQYIGSEQRIKELEKQIKDTNNDFGIDRTERDLKISQLRQDLEEEKKALQQLHDFAFGSEQQQKQRVQELEIQHQSLVQRIKESANVIDQQELQARADRISAQITYIQSRENSLAEDQKRLARGLAEERINANQSEMQNFIDNMVMKANKAQQEMEQEILRLAQKREEVEVSLEKENELYEKQRKKIIAMWNVIQSHHYSTMQANLAVTQEVVGKQINLYNQLAEAAKNASSAASMGGSRGVSGYRANGGPVMPGRSYVVGETGREIFTPSSSGRITPIGDGGNTLVININAPVGSEEYARIIGQEIVKDLSLSTAF